MKKGLIGKKIGMTQIFTAEGKVIPVTVVEAGPCVVTQKKTMENDGYEAVQVGFGDVKINKVNKPMKGHFDKNGVAPKKTLKEFRLEDCSALNVGDIIKADTFAEGEIVDVKGTSKATEQPVLSSVGISPDSVKLTVQVLMQDIRVHSVLAQVLQEYSRAEKWQVITVTKQ